MLLTKLLRIAGWILKMTFFLTPKKTISSNAAAESVNTIIESIKEEQKHKIMIKICHKNNEIRTWELPDSDSYEYNDNQFFIVLKEGRPIGIYNMETISYIEITNN